MGPITKRPSGPRQMGSRGKGCQLGEGSGGDRGCLVGSPQSRLWHMLGTGEAWSFSLATLSGLPEPGADLRKDKRSGCLVIASSSPRNQPQAWLGLVHNRAKLGKQVKKDPHGEVEGGTNNTGPPPSWGSANPSSLPSHFCSTSQDFHPEVWKQKLQIGVHCGEAGGRTYSGADSRGGEKIRGRSVRAGEPEVTQATPGPSRGPDVDPHPTAGAQLG